MKDDYKIGGLTMNEALDLLCNGYCRFRHANDLDGRCDRCSIFKFIVKAFNLTFDSLP